MEALNLVTIDVIATEKPDGSIKLKTICRYDSLCEEEPLALNMVIDALEKLVANLKENGTK